MKTKIFPFKIVEPTRARAARQALCQTQSAVASRVGVTQAQLSAFERGQARLRPAEEILLAKILGLPLPAGIERGR